MTLVERKCILKNDTLLHIDQITKVMNIIFCNMIETITGHHFRH